MLEPSVKEEGTEFFDSSPLCIYVQFIHVVNIVNLTQYNIADYSYCTINSLCF